MIYSYSAKNKSILILNKNKKLIEEIYLKPLITIYHDTPKKAKLKHSKKHSKINDYNLCEDDLDLDLDLY